MSDLFPVTLDDMIHEIERELALRHRVYPRWVAGKNLQQRQADRQIAILMVLLDKLKKERTA